MTTDAAEERLDVRWVRAWCERGGAIVVRATDESHRATDALVHLTPIPSDLTTLYWVLAEARLPDGRSVHPPATFWRSEGDQYLAEQAACLEVVVGGADVGDGVVFGYAEA
ncbi:hypothetical protein [Streptomyces bauhiniae]|uniref:hypothetical protein n=1 Tax=Streptomyces bauhiniae TaxID=2340725 RepID=UPI0034569ABB